MTDTNHKIFGIDWSDIQRAQRGDSSALHKPIHRIPGKDYGADPIGNDQFRMVPSGDIVNFEERQRRLA